jgi:hypothetical protein
VKRDGRSVPRTAARRTFKRRQTARAKISFAGALGEGCIGAAIVSAVSAMSSKMSKIAIQRLAFDLSGRL